MPQFYNVAVDDTVKTAQLLLPTLPQQLRDGQVEKNKSLLVRCASRAVLFFGCCAVSVAALAQEASVPAFKSVDSMEARVQGCVTCHGQSGQGTHSGYFPRIAGKPAGYLYNQLVAFRDGTRRYLLSAPPVRQKNRPHELHFPYNNRELLLGWRALYFREGEYVPDPKQSAQWNRGAYLVQGLGHCAMCHTAINALGGSSESKAFEGGMIPNQNWYAPSLTSNREAGLGNWSIKDISDLLQVGISNRGTVYGPMAEVVYNSLQYLSDEDVAAMAVYLKDLPMRDAGPEIPSSARLVAPSVMELGRKSYEKQCAMCHGAEGKGQHPVYPPLANNQSITMASPVNSIRMVLNGGYPPGTKKNPRPHGMPPFSHILNDDEVSAVVTYIRVAWGNSGTPVTAAQANELRKLLPE